MSAYKRHLYLVMRLLWQKGPRPAKDIASVLQPGYGTLSRLLKRLQAVGLISIPNDFQPSSHKEPLAFPQIACHAMPAPRGKGYIR